MSRELPVLIAGAGLAGLSTAYHLGDSPYRIVEAESEIGGLCRSIRERGFTFDYTGHLLHLRRPEIRELVAELLPADAFVRIDRRSGIFSSGVYTEYPFQVNTHGLPRSVARECVMGFADVLQRPHDPGPDPSFRAWALDTFGAGITRHFLFPYNEKLFCADLETVTADWVSWSIPRPTWADVVRGALGTNRKTFGYNPQFLYPAEAGIDHLPRAFLPRLRPPETNLGVAKIFAAKREALLSNGERLRYRSFVSTMPLDRLIQSIDDAPPGLRDSAGRLRAVSVLNLNLGYDSTCPLPYQWIYFPEPKFPFYRVGIYTNLAPRSAPAGTSSFYVEISHPRGAGTAVARLIDECDVALRTVGLVGKEARRLVACPVHIPVAYVVHDRARREILERAQRFLEGHEIHSIGRYGNWEYAAMEDALWQGQVTGRKLS